MLWAFKSPIRGVGAPTPNFDPYASSYNHIFIQNTRKLHFLCPARLVGYEYVEENVEKILQHFLEEKNTHFFGVGAPMPIFEPYISSYNHIFDQNATKLHFLYPTKLVGYKYVEKNVEKIPQHFLEEKKTHFFGVGAPAPILEPYISSYDCIFDQNATKLPFLYPTKLF